MAYRTRVVSATKPDKFFASLSAAKQNALLMCLENGGLQKGAGAWGRGRRAVVSGSTVADLGRDGLLGISSRRDTAWLTDNGLVVMGWHHKAAELAARKAIGSRPGEETTIPAP